MEAKKFIAGTAASLAILAGSAEKLNENLSYPEEARASEIGGGLPGPLYSPEFVADCADEALGFENPARGVGSGYVGNSLRKFSVRAIGNAIADQCRPVIASREVEVSQVYKGKTNTRRPVRFSSLEDYDMTKRTTLKRRFTCIKGRRTRGYVERVKASVDTIYGTYTRKGRDVVRSKSGDGC